MRSLKSLLVVLVVILAVSAAPAWLRAQTASTGAVIGTVADPTGAVVPGAELKLENAATGTAYTATTNAAGQYSFYSVAPGTYKLTAAMQGFRTAVVSDLKVEVAKSHIVDVALELGELAQVVEVTAGAGVELQTTDATVGSVVGGEALLRLPTANRSVSSLLMIQPLTAPGRGVSNVEGGNVAGARSDQTVFMIDGGDATSNTEGGGGYNTGFEGVPEPMIPVPVDSIEEFRVSTTNPNATFGRSQGGQVSMTTKRGTNSIHGSVYWYHQNDNFNANSWTNNRTGVEEPELKDNRYGFSVGGPIIKDKTYLFGNYEGRRFPRSTIINRLVPTATMRQGILRFQDDAGGIISYDLAMSTACGPTNSDACDPRALGISPVVQTLWNSLPTGNDLSAGDGLNTIGFRFPVSSTLDTDFAVARLDQVINDKWTAFASFRYSRTDVPGTQQVDMINQVATRQNPLEPRFAVAGLNGQITPNLTSETRFSWLRHWWEWQTTPPSPQVAGTAAALQLAGEPGLVDEPINIDTQRARARVWNGKDTNITQNLTLAKGAHTLQFGGSYRRQDLFHFRTDKVTGGLTTAPIYWLERGSFTLVPPTNRPPTCGVGGVGSSNCIADGDEGSWDDLYNASLGIMDRAAQIGTRDGDLNPLPLGTNIVEDVLVEAFEGFFQDIWRASPSLTLTLGLTYQIQMPPEEAKGRQMMQVFADTGEPIFLDNYFEQRASAARAGQIYNPTIAYSPVGATSMTRPFRIDYGAISPRLSAAWNPSYDNPFFGNRKTVIRGGYAVTYTRMNGVGLVMTPALGVGLAEVLTCGAPGISGTCGAGGDPATNFRIGVDGSSVSIPAPGPAQIPFPVSAPFGEIRSFTLDPNLSLGRSHSLDLTWQRELPGNLILEFGYVGRLGKNLTQGADLNAMPRFFLDLASGQTLAQAWDVTATELRDGVDPAAVSPQPWFENQFGAGGTATFAADCTSDIVAGFLGDAFLFCGDFLGPAAFENNQVLINSFTTDGGKSWYHAGFISLRKRWSQGLTFEVNYTRAKSIDTLGYNQEYIIGASSPFDIDVDKRLSFWDHAHTLNSYWLWELPIGRGRALSIDSAAADKIVGGWYVSGIYTATSGAPQCVGGAGNFGGFLGETCAQPLSNFSTGGKGVHSGVTGSGNVGTIGDPATGGSGLNLFSDPEAVFNGLRRPLLSQDTRAGNEAIRGLSRWNVDLQVGKKTAITENVRIVFSFDLLNVFNHVELEDPCFFGCGGNLTLSNPRNFGVLTTQFAEPRTIQFGFRIEF